MTDFVVAKKSGFREAEPAAEDVWEDIRERPKAWHRAYALSAFDALAVVAADHGWPAGTEAIVFSARQNGVIVLRVVEDVEA